MSVISYQQDSDFKANLNQHFGKLIVMVFYAQWNQSSLLFKQAMLKTIPLFGQFENVSYLLVKAESNQKIFKQFNIQYTPTVLLIDSFQNIIKKYELQDVAIIFDQLAMESQNYKANFQKEKRIWLQNIKNELDQLDTVLLMKGTMDSITKYGNEPFVSLLGQHQISFTTINIFKKHKLAQWIQFHYSFSEYPQLFVKGKLIGSYSLCKELHQKGQLLSKIPKDSFKKAPRTTFQDLIQQNKGIIFVEGFSFEKKESNDQLSKLSQKYTDLVIYNTSLCQGLKEVVMERTNKDLPALFVLGKHKQ